MGPQTTDIVAWITQGAIADRNHEALGRADKGIILYRQMLEEAMAQATVQAAAGAPPVRR